MNQQYPNRRASDLAPVAMDAAERRKILLGATRGATLTTEPAHCGSTDWSAFWAQQSAHVATLRRAA